VRRDRRIRLAAEQIIMLGRHADRIALAKKFAATDIVSERGDAAVQCLRELTGGFGVHSVLECVGLEESMHTAIGIARPGGAVGRVGVPQDETLPASLPAAVPPRFVVTSTSFCRTSSTQIEPEQVFDRVIGVDEVPDGCRAMDKWEAVKVMVEP
jgi:threonine dehydrogenase-like Zn-dependent dehydrogenase